MLSRHIRRHALIVFLSALALSCGRKEPIAEFWSYSWGTPYDSVVADSADIQYRLGGEAFRVERDSVRITFSDVQYGMGYDRVVLDFTPDGRLWHGNVRVPLTAGDTTRDSVLNSLHRRFGPDTDERTIAGDGGHITYWYTRDWLDRDFYAADITPDIQPNQVVKLDLIHGGCPVNCPIYNIRILPNGDAYMWALRGVDQLGGFKGRIDTKVYLSLAAEATEADFLSLADLYTYEARELPVNGIRADFGNFVRASESADGCGPPPLEAFMTRADDAVQDIQWQRIVAWDTIRLFDQYKVNLDSIQTIGQLDLR